MKDFIVNCFEEYKKFLNIQDKKLPKINPIIDNKTDNVFACVLMDEIKYPVTNIYYKKDLDQYSEQFVKSKLFHEFTHIIDYLVFSQQYSEQVLISIMSTYSEYHASQIELMSNIGYKNIRSLKRIDIKKTLISNGKDYHNVESDYLGHFAESLVVIRKPKDSYMELDILEYFTKFRVFSVKAMYYMGKRDLCEMISTYPLVDLTQSEYKEFSPYLIKIKNDIQNKKYDLLYSSQNELWHQFKNSFPNKHKNNLPLDL